MKFFGSVLLLGALAVSALPTDPVIRKLDENRFQHVQDAEGRFHLVDLWAKASDAVSARYDPDRENVYHLFTRENPSVSQPILSGDQGLLGITNYDPERRTIIILHGWRASASSDITSVLVPAYLSAEDVNVFVVDWSAGAGSEDYAAAVTNTVTSGQAVARFINWLNGVGGASPASYHIVGHNLGAHQAGIVGRNVDGDIAYITGLEAALPGWVNHADRLRESDALYTEVIHTNAGALGFVLTLGHVDFYPNGGINMPGCDSQACDTSRSYFYLAESLTSGGFTGRRCGSYLTALTGVCGLEGSLQMGGLLPKTGSSGVYYLETNAGPPFSRG